jgi:hypothetical protein
MAIVTGSAMGFFKGKMGNAVSYQLHGKNVVRALPSKSAKNKRGSLTQNLNRSRFTKMQEFLQPILHFIRVGFNMEAKSKQMSAHNAAKSYNMLNAFSPEGEIEYAKVLVSFGNLDGVIDPTVVQDDAGLHFSWKNNSVSHLVHDDDQVMLLAYRPKDGFAEMRLSGARRNEGHETLGIDGFNKGDEIHTWMAFISDDRQKISMSTYVAAITV